MTAPTVSDISRNLNYSTILCPETSSATEHVSPAHICDRDETCKAYSSSISCPAISVHANSLKAIKRRRPSPLAPPERHEQYARPTQQSSIPLLIGGVLDSPASPSKRKQGAPSTLQPMNLYRPNPFNSLRQRPGTPTSLCHQRDESASANPKPSARPNDDEEIRVLWSSPYGS